ncbi:uncharacterized protein LOC114279987 [Camellia sinensis]|uniref:uncharacterized protein LOC114279987 n=1 Tax=Camellia sinensis TaxID=4442 RepID=UPI00103566FE|nr:uncharacterized protein LOC114279987 [Camellia sinensis]
MDPVKEQARKEVEALKKKKKKKRSAPEEVAEESGAKRAKVAPMEVEVPAAKDAPEVVEIIPTVEVVEIAPPVQVEAGVSEAAPSGRGQVQQRPDPQEGGDCPATTIYHARAVAGRLEGEGGPARAGADRLVKIVEEGALRAASGYNEADLLRGLCSAQMEVTTLAGALLRKAGAAKLKAEEARAQLAKLRKDSADWETAYADLPAVKLELEDTRRKVVSLEFQLVGEQKKLEESKRACAVAVERHEEAMTSNEELVRQKDEADSRIGDLLKELGEERARAEEDKGRLLREWEMEKAKVAAELESLRKGMEEERATAAAERVALQRELDEERAKAASEKAAYPDLCVAAVEQYKGSPEFQMVVDAAVTRSLAGQEPGGGLSKESVKSVIQSSPVLGHPTGGDGQGVGGRATYVDQGVAATVVLRAREAVAALKKKKEKKKRGAPEEAAEESGAKRAKVGPTDAEVPAAKDAPEVVEIIPTVEVVEMAPPVQVEAGVGEAAPSGREQVQRRPDPQEGGVRVATAIYHARAVAGRLEGEEGPTRAGADRLVKIVDEGALRAASGYSEADLLRGLCSAQMEVTTLAGALLRKAGATKLKAEEARTQLAKLRKDSADWETAYADLSAVKLELEDTRRKVVSLEFQLAGEQKKLEESKRACAVAVERHEEAMTSNEELVRQKDEADSRIGDLLKELGEERARAEEDKGRLLREWEMEKAKVAAELESLRKGMEKERATAAAERGALQRELDEERAKAASEKAAYPDLCVAAVEQYKGSPEF